MCKGSPSNKLQALYHEAIESNEDVMMKYSTLYNKLKNTSDRYQQKTLIGKGAIKNVYKCFDTSIQNFVALAELREELGLEYYDLFIYEAWLTTSLSHTNIIKVRDVFITQDGRPCFTMDLKKNSSLKDFVKKNKNKALSINALIKVCEAVSYAHSKGIVHLDLKPENIQCDDYGEVYVCDWGLGQYIEPILEKPIMGNPPLSRNKQKTLYGTVQGTPGYMAPEQIIPDAIKDHRTDVFSLGCLLYLVLTETAPFQGDEKKILKNTKKGSYKKINPKERSLKRLHAIINKALQLAPLDRYQSVDAFQQDLVRSLSGYPVSAEPKNLFRDFSLFIKRHKNGFAALLVITSLALITIKKISIEQGRTKQEQTRSTALQNKMKQNKESFSIYDRSINPSYIKINSKIEELSESYFNSLLNNSAAPDGNAYKQILYQALQRNNQNGLIHYNLCKMELVKMNFLAALNIQNGIPNSNQWALVDIAKIQPHYSYSDHKRPPISELVSFIKKNHYELKSNHSELLFAIIKFDWNNRNNKTSAYNEVIGELLTFFNRSQIQYKYTFDNDRNSLLLENMPLVRPVNNHECISALSLLRLQTLIIDQESNFSIADLNKSRISILDLSRVTAKITITEDVLIRNLKEVILPPNSHTKNQIRRFLKSTQNYVVKF